MAKKRQIGIFNTRIRTASIKAFRDEAKNEGFTHDRLFSDMFAAYRREKADIMSRNRPAKASQSAQIAPDRVSKRRVGVREGGAK